MVTFSFYGPRMGTPGHFLPLRALLCLLAGCLLSPLAMAVEEPAYDIVSADGAFEIRRYAPMLVAETEVEGTLDEASNQGFRRIADFIFGNNRRPDSEQSAKIAMTAPVTVEPRSAAIAMTAPVTVEPTGADARFEAARRWRIHFVMPRAYTLETIPRPRNDAVRLREIAARHYLVHKYTWLNTDARVEQKIEQTLQWAQQKSLRVIGTPQLARYDPPWTLPMFRRNEIMVEIAQP